MEARARMAEADAVKQGTISFRGDASDYPVFRDELDFIRKRRKAMGPTEAPEPAFAPFPSTENQLVGLCLSGGGIRSAIFCLGFIQALFRNGLLKRIDYLSTVSGGGYLGSCLTALLSSNLQNVDRTVLDACKNQPGAILWDECNFPFAMPKRRKMTAPGNEPRQEAAAVPSSPASSAPPPPKEFLSAEKNPTRRLRYYSNYLTAEGSFIQKYFGPLLAFGRGFLFNLALILPLFIFAAALLAAVYKIPSFPVGAYHSFFQMDRLDQALKSRSEAVTQYERFILQASIDRPAHLSLAERVNIVKASENLADREYRLARRVAESRDAIRAEWLSMLVLPLAAIGLVLALDLVFMMRKTWAFLPTRFRFSYKTSLFLVAGCICPLAIQLFGALILYWNHFRLPNEIALLSLLSFLGPKLFSAEKNQSTDTLFYLRLAASFCLMMLAPAFFLFFTGWIVQAIRSLDLAWNRMVWLILAGACILYLPSRLLNINKISLHVFYRDRLSRAFLIRHDSGRPPANAVPFERLATDDQIRLDTLYDHESTTGPYLIINANLNNKKELPRDDPEGVFRTGESFIFSKYWCGSNRTGYIRTADYQDRDPHVNLATAAAISGAAANIGMGSSSVGVIRLLMALLNIRLGYWAPNPGQPVSRVKQALFGRTPGTWTLFKEMFGIYSHKGSYINLSDGGHFDNSGVYELLKRRCKYIVVADAEADPQMRFQALAYIIRLAHIDFGVRIDINLSDIKPGAESKVSAKHCVVGTIRYPETDDLNEEYGFLFYCKSSLTGDEPHHLNEYRIKHPSFPHQTTADQWFDEQQFEAYRELGYHVARESLRPISEVSTATNIEDFFIQLRQHWYPSPPSMEDRSTHFTTELNRIIEHIKNDRHLEFMDAQIFPEWAALMGEARQPFDDVNLWLPKDAAKIRSGFYVCNLMIQFMENVYTDLNLDDHQDHPGNRGWMNLFLHWSGSGMFRVAYAVSACTFSGKFQKFCEKFLNLGTGDIVAACILDNMNAHVRRPDGTQDLKLTPEQERTLAATFNPVEVEEIRSHFSESQGLPETCYSFSLNVVNPLHPAQRKRFTFGFALTRFTPHHVEILHFRIQDHLRRIGLGRQAVGRLLEELLRSTRMPPGEERSERLKRIIPRSGDDRADSKYFMKLFNSVKVEKSH
jgi:hypothetical protein